MVLPRCLYFPSQKISTSSHLNGGAIPSSVMISAMCCHPVTAEGYRITGDVRTFSGCSAKMDVSGDNNCACDVR